MACNYTRAYCWTYPESTKINARRQTSIIKEARSYRNSKHEGSKNICKLIHYINRIRAYYFKFKAKGGNL